MIIDTGEICGIDQCGICTEGGNSGRKWITSASLVEDLTVAVDWRL